MTIHKTQGDTVDHAFVLASSSIDRHLTYVAMTRHRAAVHLYVDRDELPDMAAVAARLGRDGSKETTLDYEQEFTERRGLSAVVDDAPDYSRWLERPKAWIAKGKRALENVWDRFLAARTASQRITLKAALPELKSSRDMAARLGDRTAAARMPAAKPKSMFHGLKLQAVSPVTVKFQAPPTDPKLTALESYLDNKCAMDVLVKSGSRVAEYEKVALKDSKTALDAVWPAARTLLPSSERYDVVTRQALAAPASVERARTVMDSLQKEEQALHVRAAGYVERWTMLNGVRNRCINENNGAAMAEANTSLRALASAVSKDALAELVIHKFPDQYGIAPGTDIAKAAENPNVGRALSVCLELLIHPPVQSRSYGYSR